MAAANLPQAGSAPPPNCFCGGYRLRLGHRRELMPQVYEVMNLPLEPSWPDIAVRLALTFPAGAIIGFNHGARGHAAGFRTTILVGLAASDVMIQADFMHTDERQADRRSLQWQRPACRARCGGEGISRACLGVEQLLISRQLAPSIRCHYLIRCEIQAGTTAAWSCSKAPGSGGPPRWPGSWQTGRAT